MHAMVLERIGEPLVWTALPDRMPGPGEIRVTVSACGICRTDLHVVDGELPGPRVPIIPGHEIVGRIDLLGEGVTGLAIGEQVGIPWLGHTCGVCPYCRAEQENLCDAPQFTELSLMICQMFSTGFNSGDLGGNGRMVMFPGTTRLLDICQPA